MVHTGYAKTRDQNEPEVINALRHAGATVITLHTPLDLLVGYRGVNYLLEVKLPLGPMGGENGSTLTPAQMTFFERWHGQACVVRSGLQALAAIGAIASDLNDEPGAVQ